MDYGNHQRVRKIKSYCSIVPPTGTQINTEHFLKIVRLVVTVPSFGVLVMINCGSIFLEVIRKAKYSSILLGLLQMFGRSSLVRFPIFN